MPRVLLSGKDFFKKNDYNIKDLSLVRQLLSNEKARLLHVIKMKQPNSLYALAKFLERDFKTVREDILLLKKFGFLDLIEEKSGKMIISMWSSWTASIFAMIYAT